MRKTMAIWVVLAILTSTACTRASPPHPAVTETPHSELIEATPWPEADGLFRSNPKWLGSDDAYSIELGDGRVLWLSGDTFISTSFLNTRMIATMIRNSVGIQTGYDPSTASMAFAWRSEGGRPASFFPEDDETWFWPGHGVALEDRLIVFLMATRATSEGLGFENTGWRAVSISNPGQPPSEWDLEWLDAPENPYGLIVSGSVIHLEDYVYAFSIQEPEHTVHLARWPVSQMARGDLSRPQWWTGGGRGLGRPVGPQREAAPPILGGSE